MDETDNTAPGNGDKESPSEDAPREAAPRAARRDQKPIDWQRAKRPSGGKFYSAAHAAFMRKAGAI